MVSKGLDFPDVEFVGVVLADIAFDLPDFRMNERIFQLLMQVVGRAGRFSAGRTTIQTYDPENPAITYVLSGDYRGFFESDMESRRELFWPPTSRLCLFRFASPSEGDALASAQQLAHQIESSEDVQVLGPAPSPRFRVGGIYNFNMLLKAPSHKILKEAVTEVAKRSRIWRGSVKITVDIDPISIV
jgi:primosomal protein N' (replication factor Y)